MKTLPSLTLLAAVAALIILPLSFEFAVSLLLIAGLAVLLVADYARPVRLRRMAPVSSAAVMLTERRASALRLAV